MEEDLLTGDKVEDRQRLQGIRRQRPPRKNSLEKKDASTTILYIGNNDWPFPIPIVRDAASGKWFFDTEAGKAEILARHIGGAMGKGGHRREPGLCPRPAAILPYAPRRQRRPAIRPVHPQQAGHAGWPLLPRRRRRKGKPLRPPRRRRRDGRLSRSRRRRALRTPHYHGYHFPHPQSPGPRRHPGSAFSYASSTAT